MKNAFKTLSIASILLASLSLSAIPNPASVNCIENGGKLDIRKTTSGNQYGICLWLECNGTNCISYECEEWAFFRKECHKGECEKWLVEDGTEGRTSSKCLR